MDQNVFKAFMANSTISLFSAAPPSPETLKALREAAAEAIVIACEQNVDAPTRFTAVRSAHVSHKAGQKPKYFRRGTNKPADSPAPSGAQT